MTLPSARVLSTTEEDRAFLQRRVALFGGVIGGGFLFFWLYRVTGLLLFDRQEGLSHPSLWWHLGAAAALLALWWSCRRGRRSARFIRVAELAALVVGVIATGVMSIYIPFDGRPDFILLLALSNLVLGRAVLVPSSGRSTLVLGIVVAVVLVSCVYLGAARLDAGAWKRLYPELTFRSPERSALDVTLEVAAWWLLTIVLSTATSVVIYGLRRKIRDAEQLGQYRLEEKLGEGGMGTVYRASHAMLRRPTAVKLLPPDKAGAENLRRFEQEVQLTASLRHPNTITIFDYGHTADGLFYYAMEHVDGLTLTDLVARTGPQPPGRVVHLVRQAASALVEAHGVGLVHRDIKPGNIKVHLLHSYGGGGDSVKVLDFGLVKEIRQEGGLDRTNEAHLAGTPQYMAPESITEPEAVDGRADVYALGAVAYYLLTGTHVFSGRSVVELCSHHLHSAPEPASSRLGAQIPPELEELVARCLKKDPAERPQTAFELERRLSACSGITEWTAEDASGWWATHGLATPAEAQAPRKGVLTVDLRFTSRDGQHRA